MLASGGLVTALKNSLANAVHQWATINVRDDNYAGAAFETYPW